VNNPGQFGIVINGSVNYKEVTNNLKCFKFIRLTHLSLFEHLRGLNILKLLS
jgi:hypothetical protein